MQDLMPYKMMEGLYPLVYVQIFSDILAFTLAMCLGKVLQRELMREERLYKRNVQAQI
ncbi:MAG: hypothetical protein ACRCWQ_12310 [Bacilli bacterium]